MQGKAGEWIEGRGRARVGGWTGIACGSIYPF